MSVDGPPRRGAVWLRSFAPDALGGNVGYYNDGKAKIFVYTASRNWSDMS